MRVPYHHDYDSYRHAVKMQAGGGMDYFKGVNRQYNGDGFMGSAFKFLSKYAFPVVKNILFPAAKRAVFSAQNDVTTNKSQWKDALKKSMKSEFLGQTGSGFRDIIRPGMKRGASVALSPLSTTHPKKRRAAKKKSKKRAKRTTTQKRRKTSLV